jgi:hypothetical protein
VLLKIRNNLNKLIFIEDEIDNRGELRDNILRAVAAADVFALRRKVQLYQWVEDKRLMSGRTAYNYSYQKQWVDKPVNSDKFRDRTKSNHVEQLNNLRAYRSETIFVGNIKTKRGFELDRKYFSNNLSYTGLVFKNPDISYVSSIIRAETEQKSDQNETYTDLDSYVGSTGPKKIISEDRLDKFNIIEGHILYNGIDFSNPNIGDIKIEYEVSSPRKISFLGSVVNKKLIPYRGLVEIDSGVKTVDKFIWRRQLAAIQRIIFISLLLFIVVDLLFKIIQENLRMYFLHVIPFFDKYFLYGGRGWLSPLVFINVVSITLGLYSLFVPSFFFLIILRFRFYSDSI